MPLSKEGGFFIYHNWKILAECPGVLPFIAAKIILKILEKGIDKRLKLCYNIYIR